MKRSLLLILIFSIGLNCWAVKAQTKKQLGFGVFFHYLHGFQNTQQPWNQGRVTSWDQCVNELNVNKLANEVSNIGADYVVFTSGQADRYFCFPEPTYEALTGYKRGEATSHRDLILDLQIALAKKGIKLFLYATGDGPRNDAKASAKLSNPSSRPGFKPDAFKVDYVWVKSWSRIVRSISLRYKTLISGWWIDGCYPFIGYNKELSSMIVSAAKAGNKNALIALNNGPDDKVSSYNFGTYAIGNCAAGESNKLEDLPPPNFKKGIQWHILSYLGSNWAQPGIRYSADYMSSYIKKVKQRNGMVTVDLCLLRNGSIDPEQYKFMVSLKK